MGASPRSRLERARSSSGRAHDGKRRRSCFKFLIPRQAFMTAWETIGIDKMTAA